MKRFLFLSLFLALLGVVSAQKAPSWTKKLPKAGNSSYSYLYKSGTGSSESQARNMAVARIYEAVAQQCGVAFDIEKVTKAINEGSELQVLSASYNIPFRIVCECPVSIPGGFQVYVLAQVAHSATIPFRPDDFRNCDCNTTAAPASLNWNEVKNNPSLYLSAEGTGYSFDEADDKALSLLLNKFFPAGSPLAATYLNAARQATERMLINDDPSDPRVGRYVFRNGIDDIFISRKRKINEYVRMAQAALDAVKIDDALRYYFWAFALVQSLPSPSDFTFPVNGENRIATTWIPAQMDEIFDNLSVNVDKVDKDHVQLAFSYKGQPVSSLDFTYSAGSYFSNICSVNNGRGDIELSSRLDTQNVRINYEYAYRGQSANLDPDVSAILPALSKVPFRGSSNALSVVTNASAPASKPTSSSNTAVSTLPASNANASSKTLSSSAVTNTAPYDAIVSKFVNAIKTHNYDSARPLLTHEASIMFDSLTKYGKVRVLDFQSCSYTKLGNRVIARSIPMSFTFKKGVRTNFVENIVLTFNADRKIECIAFGLDQRASDDILSRTAYPEAARQTIVTFLENYKTAYAFKRLDYIESIFDSNAVIIVGHVVKRFIPSGPEKSVMVPNKYIKRTQLTKEQYIANLRRCFNSNEYVNIRFSNNSVTRAGNQASDTYGIQIKQDYYSSTYGDVGYLYLQVDFNNPDEPVIRVRTWQDQPDPELGRIYGMGDF